MPIFIASDQSLHCCSGQSVPILRVNLVHKCPKILYTKVSENWHIQTVQAQLRLLRVYTVCHSTKYFKKQLHKKQNLGHKSMKQSVQNLILSPEGFRELWWRLEILEARLLIDKKRSLSQQIWFGCACHPWLTFTLIQLSFWNRLCHLRMWKEPLF